MLLIISSDEESEKKIKEFDEEYYDSDYVNEDSEDNEDDEDDKDDEDLLDQNADSKDSNESGREKKSNADKGKKQKLNREGEEAREKSCMEGLCVENKIYDMPPLNFGSTMKRHKIANLKRLEIYNAGEMGLGVRVKTGTYKKGNLVCEYCGDLINKKNFDLHPEKRYFFYYILFIF